MSMHALQLESPRRRSSHEADACTPSSSGRRRKRLKRCLEWPPPASAAAAQPRSHLREENFKQHRQRQQQQQQQQQQQRQQQGGQEHSAAGQLDELLLLATVAADAAEHSCTLGVQAAATSHGTPPAQGTSSGTTITAPLTGAGQGHAGMSAQKQGQELEQEELLDTVQSSLQQQQQQQQQAHSRHAPAPLAPAIAAGVGAPGTTLPHRPHPPLPQGLQQLPGFSQQHALEPWVGDLEDPEVCHWGLLPQVRAACQLVYRARQGVLLDAGHQQHLHAPQQQQQEGRQQQQQEEGKEEEAARGLEQGSSHCPRLQPGLEQQQQQQGWVEPCAAKGRHDQGDLHKPALLATAAAAAGATAAAVATIAAADPGPSSSSRRRKGIKRARNAAAGAPHLTGERHSGSASCQQRSTATKGAATSTLLQSGIVEAAQQPPLEQRRTQHLAGGSGGPAAAKPASEGRTGGGQATKVASHQAATPPCAHLNTQTNTQHDSKQQRQQQQCNHNPVNHNLNNDPYQNPNQPQQGPSLMQQQSPAPQQQVPPQMQRQSSAGVSRLSRMASLAAELRRQEQELARHHHHYHHYHPISSTPLHLGAAAVSELEAAAAAAMGGACGGALHALASREHPESSQVDVGAGVAATARAVAALERQQSGGTKPPRTSSQVSAECVTAAAAAAGVGASALESVPVAYNAWQRHVHGYSPSTTMEVGTAGPEAPAAATPVATPDGAGQLLQLKRRLLQLQLQLYRSGGGLAPAPSGGSDSGGCWDSQGSMPVPLQGMQQPLDAPVRVPGQHQQQQQRRGLVRRAYTEHDIPYPYRHQQHHQHNTFQVPGLVSGSHAAAHSVTLEQHSGVSSVTHGVALGDAQRGQVGRLGPACKPLDGGRAVPITQAATSAEAATGGLFVPRHINRTVSDITHAARRSAAAIGAFQGPSCGVEVLPVLGGGSRKSSGCSMNTQTGVGQQRHQRQAEGAAGVAMLAAGASAAAIAAAESRANSLQQLPDWEAAEAAAAAGRWWGGCAGPLPSEVLQEAFLAAAATAASAGEPLPPSPPPSPPPPLSTAAAGGAIQLAAVRSSHTPGPGGAQLERHTSSAAAAAATPFGKHPGVSALEQRRAAAAHPHTTGVCMQAAVASDSMCYEQGYPQQQQRRQRQQQEPCMASSEMEYVNGTGGSMRGRAGGWARPGQTAGVTVVDQGRDVYNSRGSNGWMARHDTLPMQLPCVEGLDPYYIGYGSSGGVGGGARQGAGVGHVSGSGTGAAAAYSIPGFGLPVHSRQRGGVGRRDTRVECPGGAWGYSSAGAAPASLGLAAHIAGQPAWGWGHGEGRQVLPPLTGGGVREAAGAMQQQSTPAGGSTLAAAGGERAGGQQPPDLATVWAALQRQRQQQEQL